MFRTEHPNQELDPAEMLDVAKADYRRLHRHFDIGKEPPEPLRTEVRFQILLGIPLDQVGEHVIVFDVLAYPASPALRQRLGRPLHMQEHVAELLSFPLGRYQAEGGLYHRMTLSFAARCAAASGESPSARTTDLSSPNGARNRITIGSRSEARGVPRKRQAG